MTTVANQQDLAELLGRARAERLDAASQSLSMDEWVAFSAFPAWTLDALELILPDAGERLEPAVASGQVHAESRVLELRGSDDEREDFHGAIWWLDSAARARTLRTFADADLTGTVRGAARHLLASGLPLPFPTWRAATVAIAQDMAHDLRSRVDTLLPGLGSEAADAGKPDEALAWIEAGRYLAESLGSVEQ